MTQSISVDNNEPSIIMSDTAIVTNVIVSSSGVKSIDDNMQNNTSFVDLSVNEDDHSEGALHQTSSSSSDASELIAASPAHLEIKPITKELHLAKMNPGVSSENLSQHITPRTDTQNEKLLVFGLTKKKSRCE